MKKKCVLNLDGKKRVTLGKLMSKEVTGFDVERLNDGTLILKPISDLNPDEAWIYHNKKAFKSMQKALLDVKKSLTTKIDASFWQDELLEDYSFANEFLKNLEPLIEKIFPEIKLALQNLKNLPKIEYKNTKDVFQTPISKGNLHILWTKQNDNVIILTLVKYL